MRWPRREEPEPPLDREDVIAIIDALTDIKAWTYDIWAAIGEEGESNEDES